MYMRISVEYAGITSGIIRGKESGTIPELAGIKSGKKDTHLNLLSYNFSCGRKQM